LPSKAFPEAPVGNVDRGFLFLEQAMNIREIVQDNVVRFVKYRQGYVFYRVRVPGEKADRTFPVPIADVGTATLPATERAIEFMRYIRKAIEDGTFVRQVDVC
jgi:hypothetical protein